MNDLMKRQIRELLNQIEDCSDKSLAMHCITNRIEFRGLSAVMRLMLSLMAKGQMDEFVIHVAEFARNQRKATDAVTDLIKDIQNNRGVN
jgi:hypothetical protein